MTQGPATADVKSRAKSRAKARDWRAPRKNPGLYWTLYALAWLIMAAPLLWDLWSGQTGGDFAREQANIDMGRWGWRFLLAALVLRPVAQVTGWAWLLRYRRLIGLFAFAYTFAHSLDYLLYARFWDIPYRVWKRRLYLWVGIVATLMTIPLAVSSLDGLRRRMGPTAWRRLHVTVYLVGLLTLWHALWEQTQDYSQSIVCSVLLLLLLGVRTPWGQRLLAKVQLPRAAKVTGNTSRLAS